MSHFFAKISSIGGKMLEKKSSTSETLLEPFSSDDYVGCDGRCDFTFLQTSLNLKNHGRVEKVYKISKKLGSGSFGKVYSAKHSITNQKRAIKQIYKQHTSTKEQKKLENEMMLLQKLSHPNILQFVEYFETDSEVFIVTDVYEGGELFDEIIRRKEFTEIDAATIIQQLLSCLSYLNQKKVVHRDIKPENIMLEKSKDLKAIKLIDFGHAIKYNPERDGLMTDQYGTPYYMAPEVLAKAYDNKCDVWSVGVISYILLCGYPPFNGRSNQDIFNKTKKGKFSFEKEPWGTVSDAAKDFITRCLTLDFAARPYAADLLTHEYIKRVNSVSNAPIKRKPSRAVMKRKKSFNGKKSSRGESVSEETKEKSGILHLISGRKGKGHSSTPRADLKRFQSQAVKNLRKFKCKEKFVQVVYAYIIAQCLPKDTREELAKVFKAWDKDNNGVLTRSEIEDALKSHAGKFESTVRWKSVFDMMDQDGSGYVEYHEFLTAATDPRVLMTRANLAAVFKIIDKDGNGYITLDELREAINDDTIVDDVLLEILHEMDRDNDGQISLEEFMRIIQ